MILNTAGQTIQFEANTASSITVSVFGLEKSSGSNEFKTLGQAELTGGGTKDTLYTLPASAETVISTIVVANTSGSEATFSMWLVPNAGSPGNDNNLITSLNVKACESKIWTRDDFSSTKPPTIPTQLDDLTDIADATATAGNLLVADGTDWHSVAMSGDVTINSSGVATVDDSAIDHTQIQNIGTNTHPQIDTHIADGTIHFTEASIDHTAIQNIGTNTHAQIDTHIASTSNPHSVTIDQVTPTTTKGDILVENGSNVVRLAVGTDDQVLTADSSTATGLTWADASAGSSTLETQETIDSTDSPFTPGTNRTIFADASSGDITIDLPTASGIGGRIYNIKKIDTTSNKVVLNPSGSETIDGELTVDIIRAYESVTLQSDGANWYII